MEGTVNDPVPGDAQASFLAAVERSLAAGAALLDDDGRIVRASPGFAGLLPTAAGAPAGTLAERLAPDDRAPLARALHAVAAGEPGRVLSVRTADEADSAPLELHVLRAEEADAAVRVVAHVSSERERVERHLVHSERLRLMGQMALGCAHELNNLLMVALSASELAETAHDGEQHQLLRTAVEDAGRLIAQMQAFGRGPAPDEVPVVLEAAELLREALDFSRSHWQRPRGVGSAAIRLTTHFEPDTRVRVIRSELRHAAVNLIVNAIDAMPHGGTLTVACAREGDDVVLRIEDSGRGIPPEVRDRIFEPFFSTKGERGLGLGLSLVAEIVARHDGSLSADSDRETGCAFEMRLPRARPDAAGPPAPEPPAPHPRPCRVLLVEDDAALRDQLERSLKVDGHQVRAYASAEDAEADWAEDPRADVLVTDLSLPGRTGLELASRLRARGARLPVVLITAWGVALDSALREERGIQSVLGKPFRREALRRAIAEAQAFSANG